VLFACVENAASPGLVVEKADINRGPVVQPAASFLFAQITDELHRGVVRDWS
jgi:hypothetical protein